MKKFCLLLMFVAVFALTAGYSTAAEKGGDPGFDEALSVYMPTLPLKMTPELLQAIKATKIVTKVTPSRIVMRDYTQKEKGTRMIQIWERGEKK